MREDHRTYVQNSCSYKREQERKFRLVRNSNLFCDTGAPLYQLSYQPNWEQVVELASYKPVKGWWWSYEYMKIMRELQSGDLYEGRSLQLRKEIFSGFKTKLLTLQLLSSLLIEFACSLFLTLVVSWKCPFGLVGLICLTCSLKNAFSIAKREERNSLSFAWILQCNNKISYCLHSFRSLQRKQRRRFSHQYIIMTSWQKLLRFTYYSSVVV